jgi:hypothetical protein
MEGHAMALTASESYELVAKMPLHERLRLIEKISCDLAGEVKGETTPARADWLAVRGIAPHLLEGEDAQAWVSRTRHAPGNGRQGERR